LFWLREGTECSLRLKKNCYHLLQVHNLDQQQQSNPPPLENCRHAEGRIRYQILLLSLLDDGYKLAQLPLLIKRIDTENVLVFVQE
jgi:hypothetical protein